MGERLSLKWNNHGVAFSKLLMSLHLNELYSDVTILCHGNYYPGHQFVLATCSEYFQEIFTLCKNKNNSNPFIIIKDINPLLMEAILNFMYKGEVNVNEIMLPELLKAAEMLKIKSLAIPESLETAPKKSPSKRVLNSDFTFSAKKCKHSEESQETADILENDIGTTSHSNDVIPSNYDQPFTLKNSETNSLNHSRTSTPTLDESNIKQETEESASDIDSETAALKEEFIECNDNFSEENKNINSSDNGWDGGESFRIDDMHGNEPTLSVNQILPMSDMNATQLSTLKRVALFKCNFCSYSTTDKSNLNRHVKIHTGAATYSCEHCSYKSIRKHRLVAHMSKIHPNISL